MTTAITPQLTGYLLDVALPFSPHAPRLRRRLLVALNEASKLSAIRKACTPDLDILKQTEILSLMSNTLVLKFTCSLVVVWFLFAREER